MHPPPRAFPRVARSVALVLLLAAPAAALSEPPQPASAELHGKVVLREGATRDGIPGVTLLLTGAAAAVEQRSTTGPSGRYRFTGLAAGTYTLSVTSPAFAASHREVRLAPGEIRRLALAVDPLFGDAVTVTATRIARRTSEVPAAVSVTDRTAFEQTPMANLTDALAGQPGVLASSKNQGYDARLVIRGAGLKARYGVRDIMILLDGIPLTDPDGLSRLDLLDPGLVESVEVVRGPGSTLWGVNSTGGAVNILTRSPFGKPYAELTGELGSFGATGERMGAAGGLGRSGSYNLHLSRQRSDNDWRPHNRFTANHATLQPAASLGGTVLLQGLVSLTQAELELPGRLVVDPRSGIDQWTAYREHGRVEETAEPWRHSGRYSHSALVAARAVAQLGGVELKPQLYLNRWSHRHPVTARINEAVTTVWGLDLQLDHRHRRGTLTAGLTFRADRQDTDAFTYADVEKAPGGRVLATLSDRPGDPMESLTRDTRLEGAYVQESWRPVETVLLDLGVRVDRVRFRTSGEEWLAYDYAGGRYGPGAGAVDHRRTYTSVSPRLGLVLELTPTSNLYLSTAQGFQTPTADELDADPALDLTRVTSYEAGWKLRARRATLDAAVFFSPVANEVIQVIEPYGATTYVNAGRTHKAGLELSGTFAPLPGVEVAGSYAYSRFTYHELSEPVGGVNVSRNGNTLPFVPRHQGAVSLAYHHPSGLRARLSSRTWGRYYTDNANTATYRGYRFVTDLAVGWQHAALGAELVITNLFDKRYAVEVQHDLRGADRFSPAPPRAVLARCTYRFKHPSGGGPS